MDTHVLKRGKRKHEQIFHVIREEIELGALEPGAPLASEAQLCERFEVSRGPVRKALAELQRRGLVSRHPGKGSFVNGASRLGEPVSKDTEVKQIVVLLNAIGFNPAHFLVYEIVEGVQQAVESIGENYRLSFQFYGGGGPLQPHAIADCHGLMVAPFTDEGVREFEQLGARLQVPMVSVYNKLGLSGAAQFHVDHAAGAYDATELLVRYGHRRISLIAEPSISPGPAHVGREQGFKQVIDAFGLPAELASIARVGSDPLVRRGNIEKLLRRPDRPTALVVAGGVLTPFVLDAVRQVGLRVPEDLSIIAFDDTPEAAMNEPRLSIVKIPLNRMVRMGVESLVMQMEGHVRRSELPDVALKPELVVTRSVGPASSQ